MRLKDKVAIITGAAQGIGKASAITFAREGAQVLVADIQKELGNLAVEEINRSGGNALFFHADVSKRDDNHRMVQACIKQFGKVDILFCNAGMTLPKLITDTKEEEINSLLDINVKSLVYATQSAIPLMLNQGYGVMIFTASKAGLIGQKRSAVYCASKGAVLALTKAMAADLLEDGIRVNAVLPGVTNSPSLAVRINESPDPEATRKELISRQPLKRIADPKEIAEAVLFLTKNEFCTGTALFIDGGMTI